MEVLKPCPFCGGDAVLEKYKLPQRPTSFYAVTCNNCGAMTYPYSGRHKDAVDRWNERTDEKGTG